MSQLPSSSGNSNSHSDPQDRTREMGPDQVADTIVSHASEEQASDDDDQLMLRALVTTKEAGVIIGKGGKNVNELRESTGVKAGVSKVVQGAHDRVLTVTGSLEGVAKAFGSITKMLVENPVGLTGGTTPPGSPNAEGNNQNNDLTTTLRLLISHNLMGTVIGRQGAKIKHIQDTSGARMTASKVLLPQSTERVVEVRGSASGIEAAILEIGRCLLEDKERAYGTILYNPTRVPNGTSTTAQQQQQQSGFLSQPPFQQQQQQQQQQPSAHRHRRNSSITRTGNGYDFATNDTAISRRTSTQSGAGQSAAPFDPNVRMQHISIPSDMVGCIIGKGGAKIAEIRKLSGSRISIAKTPHDDSGERLFTIQGTADSNERALYLLYGQLENEKERRLRGVQQQQQQQQQQQEQQPQQQQPQQEQAAVGLDEE